MTFAVVRILLAAMSHLPAAIVPTSQGLLAIGSNGDIPLPPDEFAWETPGGMSRLSVNRCGSTLTLRWKMDRRGPSFVNLELEQRPGEINLRGSVESPEQPNEAVIQCEHYESWEDLMRHRHEAWLANDLLMLLRRSGVEPCE